MEPSRELPPERVRAAFDALCRDVGAFLESNPGFEAVAVADGGIALGRAMMDAVPPIRRVGILNASFHRDDVGLKPIPKAFQPTDLAFDTEGAQVLLIDDVFATGRTVRAALNELFDHGRPAEVRLAVLIDTGHRRFPVCADFVGLKLPLEADRRVLVEPAGADASAPFRVRLRGLTTAPGPA